MLSEILSPVEFTSLKVPQFGMIDGNQSSNGLPRRHEPFDPLPLNRGLVPPEPGQTKSPAPGHIQNGVFGLAPV